MKLSAKTYVIIAAVTVFLGLPILFYVLGDAPLRSILKEAISLLTLLAVSLMIGQFFMARSNELLMSLFKPPQIQKAHKYIAYSAVGVILLHPLLIVLPRYFEGGVKPWEALVIMLTTFDSIGVLLGIAAWVLLLVLGITAYFRMRLMKRFANRYRGWRYFHGGLAMAFTTVAIWHSIELGRHTDWPMALLMIGLTGLGMLRLLRLYRSAALPQPKTPTVSLEGVKP